MRASVNTINSEVQRLQKMCEERRDAEESLQEKWKKIEEFDARRVELESIYTSLLRANTVSVFSIIPKVTNVMDCETYEEHLFKHRYRSLKLSIFP